MSDLRGLMLVVLGDWASGMRIGRIVKRCVHMLSAHENRNAFPLDSTLYEASPDYFAFPSTTTEMLYPGVHSDVGGGYRPGEGGCRAEKGAQLSLIALRAMHEQAIGGSTTSPAARSTSATPRPR